MKGNFTRREVLKIGAIAGGTSLLPLALQYRSQALTAGSPQPTPFQVNLPTLPVLKPVRSDNTTDYYEIIMRKSQVEILPGLKTDIWAYNGSTPGPTIVQLKDRQSVVRFVNELDVSTSTHLHGMASLPPYDGYAMDLIKPGYYKDYIYPNKRAATLWYHDHAIENTARNVYMGLAGMYIVQDASEELNLRLPEGKYDVPLIIQDKIFANNGKLVFNHNAIFDPDNHRGLMGDVILVNGVPWPKMEVANRKYRFRILNGSVSRAYRLALSTGDDLIVIGSDGGLMAAPVRTQDLRIGMAERYEVVVDFSKYEIGTRVILKNLSVRNNTDYDGTGQIMCFDVVRQANDDSLVPSQLRPFERLSQSSAVRLRRWAFEHRNQMWVINGLGWNENRVDANPGLGDIEIWEFITNATTWSHPIHLHLVDFQIVERNHQLPLPYERGWKDVVYTGESDNIRVIARFAPHQGKYMMHCHNAAHEDHDMMTQFQVGRGGLDPMSVPASLLPAPPL